MRPVRVLILLMIVAVTFAIAQGPPPMRKHTATKAQPLRLVEANQQPNAHNESSERTDDNSRVLQSNGIPKHLVGAFPNRGNPHTIASQRYRFEIPANPKVADHITPTHKPVGQREAPNRPFGIALNGVLLDPGTAEFWQGNREADWNYDALGGAVGLGLDENHAHVQPGGAYHYHGLPKGYLQELSVEKGKHSPQIGWAADGFPIYAQYGFSDPKDPNSAIVELTSSYRLRAGNRPGGNYGPGGQYDGAFTRDYEYVEGSGTLDECNGRFCVTPESPEGTYAYFLTAGWPVVPRNFRGHPIELRGRGPGRR